MSLNYASTAKSCSMVCIGISRCLSFVTRHDSLTRATLNIRSQVGNGKSVAKCDNCFAAFINAQTAEVVQYINIAAALQDPTGTFVSTAKNCASTVVRVVKSKMTPAQQKKAKYMSRCFRVDATKLKKTKAAVEAFGGKLLG